MKNMLSPAEWLTSSERQSLLQKSDWRGAYEVAFTWGLIAASFALVIYLPHPITYIIAWLVIGGRQLGCAVILHDTGHHALFKTRWLNDVVGSWLGGYPVMNDMYQYRPYHNVHHVHNGTEDDPDILLTTGYPSKLISMTRKFFRDLSGITGLRSQFAFTLMQLGILEYNLGKKVKAIEPRPSATTIWRNAFKRLSGPIAANLMIFGILYAVGHPLLYLLWVISLFSTYQLFTRIRAMAEHSMTDSTLDPYRNTRTTLANPIEKLLFAPHYVNYHVEHHLLMTVPPYRLPRMHRILKDKGFYEKGIMEKGYWNLLKKAVA